MCRFWTWFWEFCCCKNENNEEATDEEQYLRGKDTTDETNKERNRSNRNVDATKKSNQEVGGLVSPTDLERAKLSIELERSLEASKHNTDAIENDDLVKVTIRDGNEEKVEGKVEEDSLKQYNNEIDQLDENIKSQRKLSSTISELDRLIRNMEKDGSLKSNEKEYLYKRISQCKAQLKSVQSTYQDIVEPTGTETFTEIDEIGTEEQDIRKHQYQGSTKFQERSKRFDQIRNGGNVRSLEIKPSNASEVILNRQKTPGIQRSLTLPTSTKDSTKLSIDDQSSLATSEVTQEQNNQAADTTKETYPQATEGAEPEQQSSNKLFYYDHSSNVQWYRNLENKTITRLNPNGKFQIFSEILLNTKEAPKEEIAYFLGSNKKIYSINKNGNFFEIKSEAPPSSTHRASSTNETEEQITGEEPGTEILDLNEYFDNSLKNYPDKHSATFMVMVKEKAESYIPKITEFSGTKYSVDYFVIDENLLLLIEILDKINCNKEPELFAKKTEVINYIKGLIQELDNKVVQDN